MKPKVKLKYITPLVICSDAIRQCHQSQDRSDTRQTQDEAVTEAIMEDNYGFDSRSIIGSKDKALIDRVGVKFKHESTLEHIVVSLDISDISRALLQEWSRTRHMSQTVQSSRYTLGALKDESSFISYDGSGREDMFINDEQWDRASKYIVLTGDDRTDYNSVIMLDMLRINILSGTSNDITKYNMCEALKTSLTATINFRSLRNMLSLRSDKSALYEYRLLTREIYNAIPEEYHFLLEECMKDEDLR
jgi:thymidylate synthase (FAD)